MTSASLNSTGGFASLTCSDLAKSLHFYVDGLGFEVVDKNEVEGKLVFAMLKSGSALLGIGQDDFAKGRERVKGVGLRMWYNTKEDVTSVSARVKYAGIKLDNEPEKLPWGPMGFALTDPDGFLITIVQDG